MPQRPALFRACSDGARKPELATPRIEERGSGPHHCNARDSTTESVVMHAPCSVLVATHSQQAQAARQPVPRMTAVLGG
jgi:hypothetical protein